MAEIYIEGSNKAVLQKMQANGFNVTTCGRCEAIKLHEKPTPNTLVCDHCGLESDPCDFPDLITVEQL